MITHLNQRIFHSSASGLEDLTTRVNDYRSGCYELNYVQGDYLYIGSDMPFNHKFFDIKTDNTVEAKACVEFWNSKCWTKAVDLIDQTGDGDTPLQGCGNLTWIIDCKCPSWCPECKSEDVEGLEDTCVCNMYWIRVSWDQDISAEINHIGYNFSDDNELLSQYPSLCDQHFMNCFVPKLPKGTKTDWKEQSYVAAECIIKELRSCGVVWSPANILDWESLQGASVHKTAEIIFSALGQPYEYNRKLAEEKYNKCMEIKSVVTDDKNKNSVLEGTEKYEDNIVFMTR